MSSHRNGNWKEKSENGKTRVQIRETLRNKKGAENTFEFVSTRDSFNKFSSYKCMDVNSFMGAPKKKTKKNCDVYLNNINAKEFSVHIPRLIQQCSVKVRRDNLEDLKAVVDNCTDITNAMTGDSLYKKCKFCNKIYTSDRKLQKHQENKHVIIKTTTSKTPKRVSFSEHIIVHEVKEYHRCRKCTKIFEDYRSLKSHMKQTHKKRKCYICHYCNKNFVDRMFFKVHIKLHCDVCGLLFPNKSKYIEHRRNFCRVLKKYNCKTCNESFFKFMDLKDHSYDHLSTFFICDICKEQCPTKCGVSHHIAFLHSNNRPAALYSMLNLGNERLYLCNFCDESSVEKEVMEKHSQVLPDLNNRAMTGYEDYYFCDQCLKQFAVESDMLQHKWTHFLNTSDNSQVRQNGILKRTAHTNFKKYYNVNEDLPNHMLPKVVVEKINVDLLEDVQNTVQSINLNSVDLVTGEIKKPIVDPKSKKTLISKHQCQTCNKYFSSNYCLKRHLETQHSDYETLQCKVCEEVFVWPSLLRSHKCIRLNNLPEMPFQDARPEIHFDNLNEVISNGFDDLNIEENDNYMDTVDFEIPAPIVELTEYSDSVFNGQNSETKTIASVGLGYKLVMQEVPIEF